MTVKVKKSGSVLEGNIPAHGTMCLGANGGDAPSLLPEMAHYHLPTRAHAVSGGQEL